MKKLKQFRNELGWSQVKLSNRSGVSQTYISELESGGKNPTLPIVRKLAKALDKEPSELIDEEE